MASKQSWQIVIHILLLLIHIFLLWKIHAVELILGRVQLWDFDIYYRIAQDVLRGLDPYQLPYMQTAGPPLVILFFVPFAALPLSLARGLMAVINIVSIAGTAYVLAKQVSNYNLLTKTLVLNALLLVFFPTRFNFIVGQPNPLVMFLLTLVLTSPTDQGIFIGLLSTIKTNYVVMLLALVRGQRANLFATINVMAVAGIVSLFLFSPTVFTEYLGDRARNFALQPPQTTDVDYYNQSLRATTARFHAGAIYPWLFVVAVVGGSLYLLKSQDVVSGIVLSLLLSPIIWQHYLIVVYPILFLLGSRIWRVPGLRWWWLITAILLTTHLPWLHGLPANLLYALLASHYFWGLLSLLGMTMYYSKKIA